VRGRKKRKEEGRVQGEKRRKETDRLEQKEARKAMFSQMLRHHRANTNCKTRGL